MKGRVQLSAIQLRRAIENAGELFTAEDLIKLDVVRTEDKRADLPAPVFIGGITYRGGYDCLAFAEKLERWSAVDKLSAEIEIRLARLRRHYAQRDRPTNISRGVGGDARGQSPSSRRPDSMVYNGIHDG